MCTGTEKARIVMDDEIHRNIMDIFFKAPFIFKCGTETGGFEELKEARHDTARNKHAAKCPEIERQIAAKTAHNDAKQRQCAAAIGAAVSQRRRSRFPRSGRRFHLPVPKRRFRVV